LFLTIEEVFGFLDGRTADVGFLGGVEFDSSFGKSSSI